MRALAALALSVVLTGCAAPGTSPEVLLLGEQHDAPAHQENHRRVVTALANQGHLAALALEMAEAGHTTTGIAPSADDEEVRQALAWDAAAWPWAAYAPAILAAVRAGVPVAGANTPRAALATAMADPAVDSRVPPDVLEAQRDAVRVGHCGLLPEPQVARLARAQIVRDEGMARVVESLVRPGKTVVLLTGTQHADPSVGIPLHLRGSGLAVESRRGPPAPPLKDYCAELRLRMGKPG